MMILTAILWLMISITSAQGEFQYVELQYTNTVRFPHYNTHIEKVS